MRLPRVKQPGLPGVRNAVTTAAETALSSNDRQRFEKLPERMPDAVGRAKRPRPEGASSTEVGRLVERLLALAAAAESN